MKKLILLLSLIITLIGCGGNSDHKQDKIENIITKEVYSSSNFWSSKLFNKAKYFEVIENQTNYELFIDELNSVLLENRKIGSGDENKLFSSSFDEGEVV